MMFLADLKPANTAAMSTLIRQWRIIWEWNAPFCRIKPPAGKAFLHRYLAKTRQFSYFDDVRGAAIDSGGVVSDEVNR